MRFPLANPKCSISGGFFLWLLVVPVTTVIADPIDPPYELRFYEMDNEGTILSGSPSKLVDLSQQLFIGGPIDNYVVMDTGAELRSLQSGAGQAQSGTLLPAPPILPKFASYTIDHWHNQDGLPSGAVRDLLQTQDGYLWVATDTGVARFDGRSFRSWDSANYAIIREYGEISAALAEGQDGTLWLGMRKGLLYKRPGSSAFLPFKQFTKRVESLHIDQSGALWIGAAPGIFRWKANVLSRISGCDTHVHSILERPEANEIWFCADQPLARIDETRLAVVDSVQAKMLHGFPLNVCWDREDRLWLPLPRAPGDLPLSSPQLSYWRHEHDRPSQLQPVHLPGERDPSSTQHRVTQLLEGRDGTIWVQGAWLWQLAPGESQFRRLPFLPRVGIRTIYEDRSGNLWIGSDSQGLFRLRRQPITTMALYHTKRMHNIWSLAQAPDQSVWMTTNSGVIHWRGRQISCYLKRELFGSPVRGISVDSSGQAIAGFGTHGVIRLPPHPNHHRLLTGTPPHERHIEIFEPQSITPAPDGGFWIGSSKGFWKVNGSQREGPFHVGPGDADEIRGIYQDGKRGMWIATDGGGIHLWKDGQIVRSIVASKDFPHANTWIFHREDERTIWTAGLLYRHRDGTAAPFPTGPGLPSYLINQFLPDHRDRYWIGSENGIFRISRSDLHRAVEGMPVGRCVGYDESHGMFQASTNSKYQNSGIRTSDGRLWMATTDGVAIIDPEIGIRQSNTGECAARHNQSQRCSALLWHRAIYGFHLQRHNRRSKARIRTRNRQSPRADLQRSLPLG